jgi:hypothetical protein
LLWANTHGGFIVGFVMLGTYLAGSLIDRYLGESSTDSRDERMTRHLALVLLGTFAVSFINPSGYGVVVHPFAHLFGDDFLFDFTQEFSSPDFHNPLFWPFLAMIVISVVLSFRWSATNLLLAGSWTAFALYSFRNTPVCPGDDADPGGDHAW